MLQLSSHKAEAGAFVFSQVGLDDSVMYHISENFVPFKNSKLKLSRDWFILNFKTGLSGLFSSRDMRASDSVWQFSFF